ncbi:hypothetical protein FNV43_RR19355 [Rhamnella rubrinervis]|uniref:Uncharacterized protein n=1 Tax=Rhamnella rubrinervis TaxID=2594499 RepID=A0A8K0GWE8_9ROSA|nr:hypothetical protein FNV43_RR19355 [Rhamnella rubrinervis]
MYDEMRSSSSKVEETLNFLIKLFSSTYNTSRAQFDEDDDHCFDEGGGGGVNGGDYQRIDHVDDTRVPLVSISSSLITESENNVKITDHKWASESLWRHDSAANHKWACGFREGLGSQTCRPQMGIWAPREH